MSDGMNQPLAAIIKQLNKEEPKKMIKKLLNDMGEILQTASADAEKFDEKGNASAGRRIRMAMQNLKKKAQAVRIAVTEAKKG